MLEIFKEPFMHTALIGGLLTACLCAYLGVFIILKRIVFMGVALSQVAALGVAVGLFLGINPQLAAFIVTLVGVVLFWIPFTEKRISRESIIGFTYCLCAALSIILVAKNPIATARGLNLISGNLLYTTWQDLLTIGGAAFLVILLHTIYFKEFIFVSFDRETAFTTGIKANVFDFILYMTIGVIIALSMKTCGVIFVFASLVIPAMIGLILGKRISSIFFLSCLAAGICVMTGLILSYMWDLPSAPTVVGCYSVVFVISFLLTRK